MEIDAALDPHAARLLHMLRAGETGERADLTPRARRESLRALAELAGDPCPPEVRCELLACPARDGAILPLRRYTPEPAEAGAALLYLHGGGWVAGDLDTHDGVCGALAQASGCSVFALEYRRPPERRFPGPIEDTLDALAWLAAGPFGTDTDRLGLAGDSAGANLAAAAADDPRSPGLKLLFLICPILDLPRTGGSRERFAQGYFLSVERLAADAADYLQGVPPEDPRASPLRSARLAAGRATRIHAAACDPFRDEALAYTERLRASGADARAVVHPGMIHYFYALPRAIPYARTALAEMGSDVREVLARA